MTDTIAAMGTLVTIQVVDHRWDRTPTAEREEGLERAFGWFRRVEACCTRFDPQSEVMQLTSRIGVPVPVSDLLFEVVQFSLAVATESGGTFDPTVGYHMESRGFSREYRTGQTVRTDLEPGGAVSYRDVHLDPERKTIALGRPLILDLGAVAKGLAIDMAARELRTFGDYAIDAGGDLYLGGRNPQGAPWTIGIRHPRLDNRLIDSVSVSDMAVCTSGDYERRSPDEDGHHIVDPRTGTSPNAVASVTVVGPTATLADALATAAFVAGPADGIHLCERHGVEGLIVLPTLERYTTQGWCSVYTPGHGATAAAH